MWLLLIPIGLLWLSTQRHSHQCAKCGLKWTHNNFNNGNPRAHTCDNCGTEVLEWTPDSKQNFPYSIPVPFQR